MKKGFTLVELLCVIVIISVVTLITVPIINTQIVASRNSLYKSQLTDIEDAAKKWAIDNNDLLDKNHINSIYVSLEVVQKLSYLEKDQLINPKTKEKMNGCILISYNHSNKSYSYLYEEKTCSEFAESNEEITAYIIYDRVSNNKAVKNESTSNEKISAAQYIIDLYSNYSNAGNILKVDGETESGLYDLENEYVFRGSDVNNYVTYEGKTWRILSIDKETNSMKLIKNDGSSGLWGDEITFNKTDYYTENSFTYTTYKIDLNTNWNINIIADTKKSRNIIKQEVKSNNNDESILYFGLLSVYDYINASTSDVCHDDFKNSSCGTNNYLKDMFKGSPVWTFNRSNETNIWYINALGNLETKSIRDGSTYYKYPAILLNSSVYIENETTSIGSLTAPFELK